MDTKKKTSAGVPVKKGHQFELLKRISHLIWMPVIILVFLVAGGQEIFAQGVGIGETRVVPHASSILELRSTERGFLIPRMTQAERDAINGGSPANGLIIYNTNTDKLNIYDAANTTWRVLFSGDIGINDIIGTANRISIDKTDPANPIIDIDANYIGQTSITTLGTITTGTWNADILEVLYGGTGRSSITANNLLYGDGTNAIALLAPSATTGAILMNTAAGAPSWLTLNALPATAGVLNTVNGGTGQSTYTDGQLLIGNTAGSLTRTTLTGTVNQVNVANGDGSITLSTPQDIHAGATPEFVSVYLSDLAANSGVYTDGSSVLTTSIPSTGNLGFWNRTGTTLSPATNGDDITTTGDIFTTGTGSMTSAGLLTAQDGIDVTAGDVDITDNLNVATNADITGTLNVDGTSTTTGITNTGNISNSLDISTATLQTTGTATLNDATVNTTLDVTGATTLASTLDVTGTTTLDGTNGLQFDAGQNVTDIVTTIGTPGLDTNLPTEKAVRDAIAAEELANGEGTSIGADGNSVDIGGGNAFTGSRTIDLDVNTLTIDPSAGGSFLVTGTTGNVTVDNTGNLNAGNGIDVTAGDVDITDNLNVATNADITGTLNVDGTSTTTGITNTGNISNSLDISTATLQTTGTATLNDATVNTTLDVTGATTLASTLDVTGTTTLDGTNGLQFDAGQNVTDIVTTIGTPGLDTNLPTEKAVRDAIAAEELANGEGTSIGADGNSVDIGGGNAFTGSRTIDLDVNTLTIDPSAGGSFLVTGTTGNVTVDNTGNLNAGNGIDVTAGDVDITDNLNVATNADITGTLNVDGTSTTTGITNTGNISNSLDISTATLQTTGTATLNDATVNTTLDVTGATTLASTLDVTGTTTLDGTNGLQFDAGQNVTDIVTTIGTPGLDTNLPTEKAVRDAIAAEELANGEGTSIGADGNSVDIGGGNAFTGSRTIDLDVNTLTIDPSAGGSFLVTGTTGNVTVDNTGNLNAGNGIDVTAGDVDITDNLNVATNADITGTLNVDGTSTTTGITNTGNISNSLDISTATLQTTGTATLNDATVNTTLDVTGATTLASTLDVTGTTTLDGTNGLQFDAGQNVTDIVTTIGTPGLDTNLPTEKAVRDAIAAEELANGEGTSIGADGNSVDIGGGNAFTGSRTIDLDVNTLTIDPSAGGSFLVTGTTGNVTVDNTGNLNAGNGIDVTAGDVDITDNLNVATNADITGTLNVDGTSTTTGITNTGNISNSLDISTATLQTTGTATLNDATVNTTLDVTGATTLASTLDVTGTTTLDGTNGLQFDAGQNVTDIVTTIGTPGLDTNLPTEKAVRDAIAAEELANGEGTSIGADGNSVDIGGGNAFTGSRTIDLDVNTLTIDPSAGGSFLVTGTTGNVTVDNTGNLNAGNGIDVTAGDVDITDNLNVATNADITGTLNVDGTSTTTGITNTGNISNSLDISTATLQTTGTATLNDATVNTTLDVTGATTLASTLDVTGTTTLDGTNGLQFDAGQNVTDIVTTIGTPGLDTNLPTEKAVRDAIAAEELANGEGTSIGADGNSVDIGGGNAFTGSRTIDLDVNTLTIDPSAGGSFLVTGTTGNVTVDNTGNLNAGNGIDVTAGDVDITDNLNVATNADITGTLNVDGTSTTTGITNTGNISNSLDISTATLQTTGTATLNDATVNTTLDVTGATTLASTLDVTGTTTLDGTNGLQFDAGQNVTDIVTTIGTPGLDTNLPTEKAVRDAIATEELANGEGTSIGADGNSVDIGGGNAFTGSRTIDLDVNTLTIDPSAGGSFLVTGTTGNVTVDNTGNLNAGNGIDVTAGDVDITDNLNVATNADITGTLNVDGTSTTTGITNTGNISNSLDISTATLQTTGTATLNDATVNTTLDVTGATTLASTLDVTGTTTLDGTNGLQFDAGQNVTDIVTTIGTPGLDTNLPTEKAVRDAIAAEELANGEGTSIGADGNSVDIGGGNAFTGSRTIDLDVNTLTIDPSAGGSFLVTGTTGNVTVDNTGNLNAGNGIDVTAGDVDITDNLNVATNADITGTLNVDGTSTTTGITNTGNISNSLDISTATLQTTGTATLNDATVNTTLDVTGATTLASTLDVTGTTTLDGTNGLQFDAGQNVTGIVTAIGDPGVDTNLPTEKAVRDAITSSSSSRDELIELNDVVIADYGAGKVLIADGDSYNEQMLGGDATIIENGTLTISDNAITNVKLADNAVTTNEIGTDGATDANKILTTDALGDPQWELKSAITVGTASDLVAAGSVVSDDEVDNDLTIDGGTIDNTVIGATSAAAGSFTTLNASTSTTTLDLTATGAVALGNNAIQTAEIEDNNVTLAKIADGTANQLLATDATGNPTYIDQSAITVGTASDLVAAGSVVSDDEVDNDLTIDGGTIDNTVIGATSAAAGSFTTLNASTSTTTLDLTATGTVALGNNAIQTAEIEDNNVTLAKIADGTANQLLATDATGNPTYIDQSAITVGTASDLVAAGSVVSDDEVDNDLTIDGGTIDNTVIGATSAAAGSFTTLNASTSTTTLDLTATGAVALGNNAIQTAEIEDNNVTLAKIADGTANQLLATDATGNPTYIDQSAITVGTASDLVAAGSVVSDDEVDNDLTIDGGTIDNTVIGATSAAAGSFTTLNASTSTTTLDLTATGAVALGNNAIQTAEIEDNNVTLAKIADGTANQLLATDATGNPTYIDQSAITVGTASDLVAAGSVVSDDEVDNDLTIDGGTIDNTVIGATSAAAATVTDLTATSINNLALTEEADGFTIAGGTTSRTLTVTGADASVSGTNTGDQTSIVGIEGTLAEFNTALTDADFVSLAGAETLTNKTLTTPVINGTISGTTVIPVANGGTGLSATTANQILYSSSDNTIAGLASAANGVLVTNGSNVPSISSTLPNPVQNNITRVGTITNGTWEGTTVAVDQGGTGRTTHTAHGILIGDGTNAIKSTAVGSAGQVLQSGGAGSDPTYSNAVYPASTTANQLLYSSATNTIAGLTTANNSVLTTDGSGVPSMSTKIDESMLPSGTMILLYADEAATPGIAAQADVKTYDLAANTYSRIIVEAEVAVTHDSGASRAGWRFTIQYGGVSKTNIPVVFDGTDASDYHDIISVVKYSEIQQGAVTISIDVTAINANGTWYVDGFRVYGVI